MLAVIHMPQQDIKNDDYFGYPESTGTEQLRALLQNDPRSSWMAIDTVSYIFGDPCYAIWKFTGPYMEDSYVFRLSEEYLFQAEAIVRSGGSLDEAKTLLKTVMSHAGISDFSAVDDANTAEELLVQIFEETTKNLGMEDGQEWFALLRMPLTFIQSIRPAILDQKQFILPVPEREFQLNPVFGDQNPGYSK